MQLYTYYRSTSSYRVRIALALKGLDFLSCAIDLRPEHSQQCQEAYLAINPEGRVPALQLASGEILIQSSAIIEYLEERYPQPPLLPTAPLQRARARALAALIGSDIQPLHNVSVLARLRALGQDETGLSNWIAHWISQGLIAVEALIDDQHWCLGEHPGLADTFLIPQLYAADRFGVSLEHFPKIRRVAALAAEHPAFAAAHPANQADSPGR
jgi:maleylacetoacetate isomerase